MLEWLATMPPVVTAVVTAAPAEVDTGGSTAMVETDLQKLFREINDVKCYLFLHQVNFIKVRLSPG